MAFKVCKMARNYSLPSTISVSAPISVVDEKIAINLKMKIPKQKVTVAACLKEAANEFVSYAFYESDVDGKIDLATQPSLGGTYKGVESMGLFWSMVPSQSMKPGTRLIKKDVMTPLKFNLLALDGHHKVESFVEKSSKLLICEKEIERWYARNVERQYIREGRIRGALFTPKDGKPHAGVIDLFGTAGGLLEFRASLLASHGFTVLALAYFDYEDLPKGIEFDYDYFDEAVQWFSKHPRVKNCGIGAIGVSKGSEIAFHMACYNEEIKACVGIGGVPFYSFGIHKFRGKEIAAHMHRMDLVEFTDEGIVIEKCMDERDGAHFIPFERGKHCEFLLIQGEDDRATGPDKADKIAQRFDMHGLKNYKVLLYPGAGHLIEPPYSPLSRVCFHKLLRVNMLYGGNPVDHAAAQEHSWNSIINFMKHRLNQKQDSTSHLFSKSKL